MKSILFAPFRYRLAVSVALALLLTFGYFALLAATSWGEWRSAVDYHARWSTIGGRCQALFLDAEAEFKPIEPPICRSGDNEHDCILAYSEKQTQVFAPVVKAGCMVTNKSSWGFLTAKPALVVPVDPGNLVAFALKTNGMELNQVVAGCVAALVLIILVADVLSRLVVETHTGWRRLNTVLSVLSGFGVAAYAANDGAQPDIAAGIGVVSIAVALAATTYLRAVVLWVADGFLAKSPTILPCEVETEVARVEAQATTQVDPSANDSISNLCPIEHDASLDAGATLSTLPAATFWPRMWARCIDLPLCWVVGNLAWGFLPNLQVVWGGMAGWLLDMLVGVLVISGIAFMYERFFIARYGATLGKMLFGISVASVENRLPTKQEASRRAWTYLSSGIYFTLFLPILQILGAFAAWNRRDGSQPWDLKARTYVRQSPIGNLRYVIAVAVGFSMISTMVISNKLIKEMYKDEVRRSVLN